MEKHFDKTDHFHSYVKSITSTFWNEIFKPLCSDIGLYCSPDQSQVGCRELRSTKYISDGQCTSINPIKELVCAGECLPSHLLPNWIGSASHSSRYWSRRDTVEWRCVIDRTRTQRIRLQCEDGSSRTYKITVVTSCKCKRYSRQQNDSAHKDPPPDPTPSRTAGGGATKRRHWWRSRRHETALPES
uniref:Sclerostin domain containing 1b n=1 Tax=Neogobius melanostomus TaxID=47308 RepID=A0A8C6V0X5_9GOBI